ncbi:hypothetical protein AYO38_03640 [bacterium SCGC AG-212-C10]|nr:hypothetical protein AYO38_03640 [bacterium SCGC AG-212-C10]
MAVAEMVDIGAMIVSTPGTVGGKPRIDGTRLRVSDIALRWQAGNSPEDIVDRIFTHISLAQVHAALAFYLVNREAIDREILESELAYEEGAGESLRSGGGAPWLTDDVRVRMIGEHEARAALLRQRLG